jgi:UDP-N-acetylmuramyl-tripeptide synthetase
MTRGVFWGIMNSVGEQTTFQVGTLCSALPHAEIRGNDRLPVNGITHDSRQVRPGYIYAAISGAHVDGVEFVEDARRRGATGILTDRATVPGSQTCSVIQVKDVPRALADLVCRFYGDPSTKLHVTGITGTNGKTSVAYLSRQMMESAGFKVGMIGTVSYDIGRRIIPASRTTPESPLIQNMFAQMVHAGCDSAVIEVSSHAISQNRIRGTQFDSAVFTNLSPEHLDYHSTMEDYFAVKASLFTGEEAAGNAIINIDDEWGKKLIKAGCKGSLLTYGTMPKADVFADHIIMDSHGSRFDLVTPWGSQTVFLKRLGRFNISNVLAAMAASGLRGVPFDVCCHSIETMKAAPGRLEEVSTGQNWKAFVDYAHTPDALEKVLQCLKEVCDGRLIVVFGCGGDRDPAKRPMMGRAASNLADAVILTSDNPRSEDPAVIISHIQRGCSGPAEVDVMEDRREAIIAALERAEDGDIVLVAGKGHETYQQCAHQTLDFDDRDVIRKWVS